ncbi:hypothetical protein G6O69_23860 [Pseudenhygromyxa sp. WMMC2535]|uniref:hypothetical protein n=1 Tax=Pseudenhygromyxa sp. WMMC2535 TaxID=2712867 RepID=UPI001554A4B2|nr:hypothetical protein [Pseudenhygromyxa sp. WMMC2535]NVB40896.1 hypothetical protein [Pseudenhygromyxa sp. WMMC2535]
MRRAPLVHALLPALSLGVALTGCLEVCPSAPAPDPFVPVVDQLPTEAVFCADETRVDFSDSGEALPEGTLPNQADLNFQFNTAEDTQAAIIEHFEARGWTRVDTREPAGERAVAFSQPELGSVLDFRVIDETPAQNPIKNRRVHAFVELSQPPCLELVGQRGSACLDNTVVACVNGLPGERIDCTAMEQTCVADGSTASCVAQ